MVVLLELSSIGGRRIAGQCLVDGRGDDRLTGITGVDLVRDEIAFAFKSAVDIDDADLRLPCDIIHQRNKFQNVLLTAIRFGDGGWVADENACFGGQLGKLLDHGKVVPDKVGFAVLPG